MQWHLPYSVTKSPHPISYGEGILLQGSCFSEHIGAALQKLRFSVLVNPSGIAFDPLTIAHHFDDYLLKREYSTHDLVQNNDLYHSYHHHGVFSQKQPEDAINKINEVTARAAKHLRKTNLLIITPGTAFVYRHKASGRYVANCHKLPAAAFEKELLGTAVIVEVLDKMVTKFRQMNPSGRVVLTLSPVRHIRDGLIENNRSKARLLEALHTISDRHDFVYYFPAYELVLDVLRDYRFFKEDGVHPSDQAARFVFEAFADAWIAPDDRNLSQEVAKLLEGLHHRPLHPDSEGHKKHIISMHEQWKQLKHKLPNADWSDVAQYFSV
jgi:lysophospholipase L1-like esterase